MPDLDTVAHDLTVVHRDRCMTKALDPGVKICSYGDPGGRLTAMLVGDSHSTHWVPALTRIANARDWRLLIAVKAGCRFTAKTLGVDAHARSCRAWVDELRAWMRANPPDIVITMATKTHLGEERLPAGYVEVWRELHRMRIPVVGIRDTPRAPFNRVDCLLAHRRRPAACAVPREPTMAPISPVLRHDRLPPNLLYVDMTGVLCTVDACPAVAGDKVIYRDAHHLTETYAKSIARRLAEQIPEDPVAAYEAKT